MKFAMPATKLKNQILFRWNVKKKKNVQLFIRENLLSMISYQPSYSNALLVVFTNRDIWQQKLK